MGKYLKNWLKNYPKNHLKGLIIKFTLVVTLFFWTLLELKAPDTWQTLILNTRSSVYVCSAKEHQVLKPYNEQVFKILGVLFNLKFFSKFFSKLRPQSRHPKIEWKFVKQFVMSSFWIEKWNINLKFFKWFGKHGFTKEITKRGLPKSFFATTRNKCHISFHILCYSGR